MPDRLPLGPLLLLAALIQPAPPPRGWWVPFSALFFLPTSGHCCGIPAHKAHHPSRYIPHTQIPSNTVQREGGGGGGQLIRGAGAAAPTEMSEPVEWAICAGPDQWGNTS